MAWQDYAKTVQDSGWGKKAKAPKATITPRDKLLKQIDVQLSGKDLKPRQLWYVPSADGSELRMQVRYGSVGLPLIGDEKYVVIPKGKLKEFLKDVRGEVASGAWDEKIANAAKKLERKPKD